MNKALVEKNERGLWAVYLPLACGRMSTGYQHSTWRDAIKFATRYMRYVWQ